jgi:pSer/pThr/pTyr-binding forkhead associated (FHA) protein
MASAASALAQTAAHEASRMLEPLAAETAQIIPLVTRAVPTRGRLVLIAKDGSEGTSFPLRDQLDLGRDDADVTIADDHFLSARHVRIIKSGSHFRLLDLGSENGVYFRLAVRAGRIGPAASARPAGSAAAAARRDNHLEGESGGALAETVLNDQDLFLVGQQVLRFEVVKGADEGFGPATQHGTLLFGTPLAPRYARLSQRTVEGVTRDVFHIGKAETVLGRESGDIVFTDDPFLSRRHAALRVDLGTRRTTLVDLGSSNGTFIRVRGEIELEQGDQFRIGQQLFRIDLTRDA